MDSTLVPTTMKYTITRLGAPYTLKEEVDVKPRMFFRVSVLFDYRCAFDGGLMGRQYPPQVQQCLATLSTMDVRQVKIKDRSVDSRRFSSVQALWIKDRLVGNRGFQQCPGPLDVQSFPPCVIVSAAGGLTPVLRCCHVCRSKKSTTCRTK